ncbi:MAG: hypothetical protein M3R14_04230 [Acidobacteriota bacterium]|nr:hypothetical protein [Acidobacteriota bacterium]
MTEDEIEQCFPNLRRDDFKITSPTDVNYNCIAWAGGDTKNCWQPSGAKYYVWLRDDKSESLENYIENFKLLGYSEETESRDYEPEFEKVALYIDADGLPSHAAKQKDNGFWTSKLGWSEDIEHRTLECLEGDDYGVVKVILKRRRKGKEEADISKTKASEQIKNFKNLARNTVNVPKKEVDAVKGQTKKKTNKTDK